MTEPAKKKTTKGRAAPARQEAATALADHYHLSTAVSNFVHENNNFESSYALNGAMSEATQCTSLQALFEVPLQHKLFSMQSALCWALFLHVAPLRAVQKGDAPFSEAAGFSPEAALGLIAQVYDEGLNEVAYDHFESEEEGGDSGSEEDEEAPDEAA